MLDFRLKVFYTVAGRESFSRAAEELHITQPAITRHIRLLEDQFAQKLFERKGYRVELTEAGQILLRHVSFILEQHQKLEFEMNLLKGEVRGQLQLAASTTIAQYWLPPVLAGFHAKFPEISISLVNENTEEVERLVMERKAQLGLIEGSTRKSGLHYESFLRDEIVLVAGRNHPLTRRAEVKLEDISKEKLLIRERGSGTLQVLEDALKNQQMPLENFNIEMELGSSESIKAYLMHSACCAFLSVHTILKELKSGELFVIDLADFSLQRQFYTVQQQGEQSALCKLFKDYIAVEYNKK